LTKLWPIFPKRNIARFVSEIFRPDFH